MVRIPIFEFVSRLKKNIQYTFYQLTQELTEFLKGKICRHLFNIRHRYEQMKTLEESLSAEFCIIHIDFSENYACKYGIEPQSVHFGASKKQVSLHTDVVEEYGKDPFCFCSMSENTRHDPSAIWAHLHPVLLNIKLSSPGNRTVHFLSDGRQLNISLRNNSFSRKKECTNCMGLIRLLGISVKLATERGYQMIPGCC